MFVPWRPAATLSRGCQPMTAYLIDYRADQLTVASDLRIYTGETTIGYGAKIYALPHLRSVLLMRGLQQVTLGAIARHRRNGAARRAA